MRTDAAAAIHIGKPGEEPAKVIVVICWNPEAAEKVKEFAATLPDDDEELDDWDRPPTPEEIKTSTDELSSMGLLFPASLMEEKGERVLLLTHRESVMGEIHQHTFQRSKIFADIEASGKQASASARLIIGSVHTMARKPDRWPDDHFDHIFVDVNHAKHALEFKTVIGNFPKAKVYGWPAVSHDALARAVEYANQRLNTTHAQVRDKGLAHIGLDTPINSVKGDGRSLILTHHDDSSAHWRIIRCILDEMFCATLVTGERDYAFHPAKRESSVVVASVRPFSGRLWSWGPDYFKRILIDTRMPGNFLKFYRNAAEHFESAEIIGGHPGVEYRNPKLV